MESMLYKIDKLRQQHDSAVTLYKEISKEKVILMDTMKKMHIQVNGLQEVCKKEPELITDYDKDTLKAYEEKGAKEIEEEKELWAQEEKEKNSPKLTQSYTPGGIGVGKWVLKNLQKIQCNQCGHPFTTKPAMERHKCDSCNVTEKKYKCHFCEKSYQLPTMLKEHEAAKHTKVFLYFCKKCGKGFYYNCLKVMHNENCKGISSDSDSTTNYHVMSNNDYKDFLEKQVQQQVSSSMEQWMKMNWRAGDSNTESDNENSDASAEKTMLDISSKCK